MWVTREIYCYILTVRGSVSLKLRADSAGTRKSWNFGGVRAVNAVCDHHGIGRDEVLEFEQAA